MWKVPNRKSETRRTGDQTHEQRARPARGLWRVIGSVFEAGFNSLVREVANKVRLVDFVCYQINPKRKKKKKRNERKKRKKVVKTDERRKRKVVLQKKEGKTEENMATNCACVRVCWGHLLSRLLMAGKRGVDVVSLLISCCGRGQVLGSEPNRYYHHIETGWTVLKNLTSRWWPEISHFGLMSW